MIIRMRHIQFIDATALRAFEEMLDKLKNDGTQVLLSGVRPELYQVIVKSGIIQRIGEDNIFPAIELALERAKMMVSKL